ncbi:GTP-binding protein TypA/BipA like protein [Termitomyces sp. J132]|nr:GTP-binding protein TypA/BipA like protein [Termitomyces sp. J132]
MAPLFDLILTHVPPPMHLDRTRPFSMLTVQIESDPYVGMLYVGRIHSGILRVGDVLWALDAEGQKVGEGKVKKIFARKGLERIEKDAAGVREIASVAGVKNAGVNVTLVQMEWCGEKGQKSLPSTPIAPPTISIYVQANDSPLAGTSGTKLTSQLIHERIYKESETNVARGAPSWRVARDAEEGGVELAVGAPKAVMIPYPDAEGRMLEPIGECTVLVREEGLIGYMAGEFENDVHGQGTINHIFKAYMPYRGAIDTGRNGALISMAAGETSGYALAPLQARGTMFVGPGEQVYPGMIIGESSKPLDLHLNPCVKKQLTNIHSVIAGQ